MKVIYSWRQPKLTPPKRTLIKLLISRIAQLANLKIQEGSVLSVNFPGPRTMRKINRVFLEHDYLTDVICFNYFADGETMDKGDIAVEIFISPDIALIRAAENKNLEYASEMVLYLVHAILHASGMQDKMLAQKQRIRQKESEIISKLELEFDFLEIFFI